MLAPDGQKVPISKWITHRDARPLSGPVEHGHWSHQAGGVDQDISMLVLSRNVHFTAHVNKICLPSKPDQEYAEKEMFVSGWGFTQILRDPTTGVVDEWTQSNVPKRVKLIGVSGRLCRLRHRAGCHHCRKPTMICAIGIKQYNVTINEDSCGGDSGGMFMRYPYLKEYYKVNERSLQIVLINYF